ncbi:unnamed protein product [Lathyrus sativus]|nr:unnamed protein product [Lathyrus sativus]
MSNKLVALLLLVCVVTAQGGKLMTPEACYNYCYKSMMYPKAIADPICKYRCRFPMYENNPKAVITGAALNVRKAGQLSAPPSSPIPAAKIH